MEKQTIVFYLRLGSEYVLHDPTGRFGMIGFKMDFLEKENHFKEKDLEILKNHPYSKEDLLLHDRLKRFWAIQYTNIVVEKWITNPDGEVSKTIIKPEDFY